MITVLCFIYLFVLFGAAFVSGVLEIVYSVILFFNKEKIEEVQEDKHDHNILEKKPTTKQGKAIEDLVTFRFLTEYSSEALLWLELAEKYGLEHRVLFRQSNTFNRLIEEECEKTKRKYGLDEVKVYET